MTAEERVDAVLADLSLDEKIGLLHQRQPRLDRHGLAEFHTGQEALHGMAWSGTATVFPQAIGLGSSWNPELLTRVGNAVAKEIRAGHHGDRPQVGLNVWAPVVDLLRDPRAGRNEEGYSEDPHLTGVLGRAYCHGLSGDDPWWHATAPTLKHFLAYNNEDDRVTTSADVRPRLLHEYYLRAFEPAIRSGAAKAVMLSYNLVNGRPNHVSPYIRSRLRRWSPELVVVSDAYAPTNLAGEQQYFGTHEESHAAALRAGLDSFTDRDQDPTFTTTAIRGAVDQGLVDEATIDQAVRRLLRMRMRLGDLDDAEAVPFASVPPETVGCAEHRALAREAVRQSIVLLRNDHLLPLPAGRTVAVIGPLIDNCLEDWYSGTLPYAATPLAGIRERIGAGQVTASRGVDRVRFRVDTTTYDVDLYDWGEGLLALRAENGKFLTRREDGTLVADQDQPNGWVVQETFRLHNDRLLEHVASGARYLTADFEVLSDGADRAAQIARAADIAVLVVGNHPLVGARETTDRRSLDLPQAQARLVETVLAANPRTVLVVESGYPYALAWEDRNVPAIVWMSHGGQETGNGLADVLFGDHSPGGRLSQTWYRTGQELEATGELGDYDIIQTGRTYLYSRTTPLYPFGHGLTYTEFGYSGLRYGEHAASVDVTNHGSVAADEVVQFYCRRVSASQVRYPGLWLCGFDRVEVAPGQTVTVTVRIGSRAFAHWDVRQHRFAVEAGEYELLTGRSAADIRATTPVHLTGRAGGIGQALPARDPYRATDAADFDAHQGVRLVPRTLLAGDAVRIPRAGWIAFPDMHFGAGATAFTALVAGGGRLEIRTGGPSGDLLARTGIPASAGGHVGSGDSGDAGTAWQGVRAHLSLPPGRHDIFLGTHDPEIRVSAFWFEQAKGHS